MNPWLARHVTAPLAERLAGRRSFPLYRRLLKSQHLPIEALREMQLRRLQELVEWALNNTKDYAELAGLDKNWRPQSLDDLIAKSQQLHSEASQFWIELYAGQPDCWGIFLWSLSDCWPQISPAYIAYPFHPKPALAAVQAAYARVVR